MEALRVGPVVLMHEKSLIAGSVVLMRMNIKPGGGHCGWISQRWMMTSLFLDSFPSGFAWLAEVAYEAATPPGESREVEDCGWRGSSEG